MVEKEHNHTAFSSFIVREDAEVYDHSESVEAERRRKTLLMTEMEKFHNFSKMLRQAIKFKNAVITHKKECVENSLETPANSPE